jgi:molecular chaperone GrpE
MKKKTMKEKHPSNQAPVNNRQAAGLADSHRPQPQEAPISDKQHHAAQGSSKSAITSEIELQQTVEKLQAELAAANDKYIRLYADFENFKKRTLQERISLIETAGERLLQEFLPILDDFERALAALRQENVSLEAVEQGVELIHDKMLHFLEQAGIQPMPVEKGSAFNAELHEAITKTPVSDQVLHNKIIDVVEKGYMLKGKVLRYAKVIIGE